VIKEKLSSQRIILDKRKREKDCYTTGSMYRRNQSI